MLRHASRRACRAALARLAQRAPCAAAPPLLPRRASHLGGVARSAAELGEAMTWPERDTWCGVLREADVGRSVTLCGWVDKQRNMGAVVFADLRDQSGFVQARSRSQRHGAARRLTQRRRWSPLPGRPPTRRWSACEPSTWCSCAAPCVRAAL